MEPSSAFQRIDGALAKYYCNCGRNDYFDEEKIGKFMRFVKDQQFEEDAIEWELDDDTDATECTFIEMDALFPLQYTVENDKRDNAIFEVIKHCYKYGTAPNQPPTQHVHDSNFSIFTEPKNHCVACNYTKCEIMNRVITALEYYTTIRMKSPAEYDKLLNEFMANIYPYIIDDFLHFKEHHEHELLRISDDLIKKSTFVGCDVNKCSYTTRHRTTKNITNKDPKLHLYEEIFDGLHFHLLHCFDAGFRTIPMHHKEAEKKDDDTNDNDIYENNTARVDTRFARINEQILKARHVTRDFSRLRLRVPIDSSHSTPKTKYNISGPKQDLSGKHDTKNEPQTTFLDALMRHLLKPNFDIDEQNIILLSKFITEHEYDSDTLRFDHKLKPDDNITTDVKNKPRLFNQYHSFVEHIILESKSFSAGYRFYYWRYYRNIENLPKEEVIILGEAGCDLSPLFVTPKYSTFKKEIQNYDLVTLEQYEKHVVPKVNNYLKTSSKFKQITATRYGAMYLHYDIKWLDPIRFEHLAALVLYTDFSEHCKRFSATFRKLKPYETIESVAKRNRIYYWMSRLLRECVEIFGQSKYGDMRYEPERDELIGPFYTGIGSEMSMPHFSLRLCAPTSTSTDIEIAMNFSGDHGVIIQLDNPDMYQYTHLHGFKASWISRFKEENERLFFGGLWYIKVESIRKRTTNQKFEIFVYGLYYLDLIITGSRKMGWIKIRDKQANSVISLVQHTLANIKVIKRTAAKTVFVDNLVRDLLSKIEEKTIRAFAQSEIQEKTISEFKTFIQLHSKDGVGHKVISNITDQDFENIVQFFRKPDVYIADTFAWFVRSKKQIVLNLRELRNIDSSIRDLFMNELDKTFQDEETGRVDDRYSNLFKPALLKLFPNVKSMIIETTENLESWSISIPELLQLTKNGCLEQVIVVAKPVENRSWIQTLWASSSSKLKRNFVDANYSISFKKGTHDEHQFVIKLKS